MSNLMKKRATIYVYVIFGALVAFEVFSYSSSVNTLMVVMGNILWARLLAFSFCAIDFAGIAKLYAPGIQKEKEYWYLAIAWFFSAFFDTALTWFSVALSAEGRATTNVLIQRGIVQVSTFTLWVPIGFAVLTWLIQVVLVVALNKIVDAQAGNRPAPARTIYNRSVTYNNFNAPAEPDLEDV